MPVSFTNSSLIYNTLKECDIRLLSALPETWLVHLIRLADEDPKMVLVRLASALFNGFGSVKESVRDA